MNSALSSTRLAAALLFASLSALFAAPPTVAPEPRLPFLPRMPALSSWKVTFRYPELEKPSRPGAPPRHLGDIPRAVVVTKAKGVFQEKIELDSGKQVERWDFDGTQFQSDPAGAVFLVAPPTEESPDPGYYDRRKSDFPELDWINRESYRGVENYEGKPAFHFETDRNGQKVSAFLSVESQMPMAFSDGVATRLYFFNPPPADPPVPPPAFLNAYNLHKRALEALKYRPGRP